MDNQTIKTFCYKKLAELRKSTNVSKLHSESDVDFRYGIFIEHYLEEILRRLDSTNTTSTLDLLELIIDLHPIIGNGVNRI